MNVEERNKLIEEHILQTIAKLKDSHGINFNEKQIADFINKLTNREGTAEEIIQIIDSQIDGLISKHMQEKQVKDQIKVTPKENPYFGEVYKSYIIHVFSIYEEVVNSDMPEEQKRAEFEARLAEYLAEDLSKMYAYLFQQTTNQKLIALAPTELHRGADTLSFDTVGNLYATFTQDLNVVSNDYEGKMYCTVPNNQRIFAEPLLDDNGNVRINPDIEYNFDMLKEIYDFAQKHGKQIKFHTFLWHNAIPENLRREIDAVENPLLKRKMALAFLQHYASNLSDFMRENGYDLRQIEALNEIAEDRPGDGILRDSWWKDVIGRNPDNGDEYFVDVLRILRQSFPDTEIIYNEYNEFIGDKNARICEIVEYVRRIEERDGITLLDGIGVQAHYTDYLGMQHRQLTAKDIAESALNLQRACGDKKIYITEFDFLDFQKNGTKEQLEQDFIESYSKIANGFIMWGNSDSLTWYHCIDKDGNCMNAQIVDSDGKPKENYELYRRAFFKGRQNEHSITWGEIGQATMKDTILANTTATAAVTCLENGVAKQDPAIETKGDL